MIKDQIVWQTEICLISSVIIENTVPRNMSPEIREMSLLLSIIGQLTSMLGQVLYTFVLMLRLVACHPGWPNPVYRLMGEGPVFYVT